MVHAGAGVLGGRYPCGPSQQAGKREGHLLVAPLWPALQQIVQPWLLATEFVWARVACVSFQLLCSPAGWRRRKSMEDAHVAGGLQSASFCAQRQQRADAEASYYSNRPLLTTCSLLFLCAALQRPSATRGRFYLRYLTVRACHGCSYSTAMLHSLDGKSQLLVHPWGLKSAGPARPPPPRSTLRRPRRARSGQICG